MSRLSTFAALLFFTSLPAITVAQSVADDFGLSGQFFFSYERIYEGTEALSNEFAINRGYITFRRNLSPKVQIRFTQDVSVDQEGDGAGDIELRLKYALVNVRANDWGFFTRPSAEFGVVRRPWINFEQSINDYRAQSSMFLDYYGFFSSADYGLTLSTLLGGEMDEDYQERVQSAFAGRYGSFSIGVYNGGGYAALEENNTKLVESRLSLRLLPERIPGFQLTFAGAKGAGNIPESPDFWLAMSAASFESEKIDALLQGFYSTGDAAGNFVTPDFEPLDLKGWSFFTELKPFKTPVHLTIRAEELTNRFSDRWIERRGIAGILYRFDNGSKIILDVNQTWFNNNSDPVTGFGVVTEVRF